MASKTFSARDFDGILGLDNPGKADGDGDRAVEKLVKALNSVTGTAIIPLGSASVAVAIGLEYDGAPALVTMNSNDATLGLVSYAEWDGAGNLTIQGSANATADVTVSYRVEG